MMISEQFPDWNTYHFYDTCSLLLRAGNLFEDKNEHIVISSITLEELENIKTSATKDADVKYAARKLLHDLNEHYNYEVVIFTEDMLQPIVEKHLSITNDTKILASAIYYDYHHHPDDVTFITNDLALKGIANLFFGNDSVRSINEDSDNQYDGYKEVFLTDDEMAYFYSNQEKNIYNLYPNEYLLIYNSNKELVDKLCWTGERYRVVTYDAFLSYHFGDIKPFKDDVYQALAFDSLTRNQITMLKGKAGSGKSIIAMAYLFTRLEKGKIDKIIVFCNTVAAKGAAKLGLA